MKQRQSEIIKFFAFQHLPPFLREVSAPFSSLARDMDIRLIDGAEKEACLRKLLEAKDCAVRAALDADDRDRHLQAIGQVGEGAQ